MRARPDLHTPCTVASVQISVASHSSQPIKRKGTHKYCRSRESGNDFTHADLASLTLLGGTSARAQVAAVDTAFVMAIHGATLVSIPRVLAVTLTRPALDTLTVIMHRGLHLQRLQM